MKDLNKNMHETVISRVLEILSPVLIIFNLVISIITLYLVFNSFGILRDDIKTENGKSNSSMSSSVVSSANPR